MNLYRDVLSFLDIVFISFKWTNCSC